MGRISKVLGRVDFQDNPCQYMDMELNTNQSVHLQSNCWRIELTEQEFMEFSGSVCKAAEKLRIIKKK